MHHDSKLDKNIILSFVIVSILVIMLGAVSIFKMVELSNTTKKLYDHPLAVTALTQNIQTNLVSMHRYMKDIVLAKDEEDIQFSLKKINQIEKIIFNDFDKVFEKYLGNKQDIQSSYDLIVEWKKIRTEIVDLMHQGKIDEATQMTKIKAYHHVEKMNKSVGVLVQYAYKKGGFFVEDALKTKDFSISILVAIVMSVLVLIVSLVLVLLKSNAYAVKSRELHTQQMLSQSRLAQMGEMISMIAHQWRQPLGAIASTSIDLKMKMELGIYNLEDKDSREECIVYLTNKLDSIEEFVQSLTNTIDDFRDFYKQNRKFELAKINESIDKTLNIVRNSFKANDITLVLNYYAETKVNHNSNEIMQVVLNILKNSEDNFKVKSTSEPTIWITTVDTLDGISIKICDNGGGIHNDIIDKIFDPYFSTKYERNGTGLGLYMSKMIIQEHHSGKMSVQNTKSGVCFKINIKVNANG